jgi:hypothetical protein
VLASAAALLVAAAPSRDDTGSPPAQGLAPATSYGVTLEGAVGCKCSIRIDGGIANQIGNDGFNAAGYLVPYLWDEKNLWTEGNSALRCAIEAKIDGGAIYNQVCPDIPVAARTGRILCTKYGITGKDGGTGAPLLSDAGPGPQPSVLTQCWGPSMSSVP